LSGGEGRVVAVRAVNSYSCHGCRGGRKDTDTQSGTTADNASSGRETGHDPRTVEPGDGAACGYDSHGARCSACTATHADADRFGDLDLLAHQIPSLAPTGEMLAVV
jgi:hypothetical protein